MKPHPPPDIINDPMMLDVWTRNHHILPLLAFDNRYKKTVLLPIATESVQRDVARLKQAIEGEFLAMEAKVLRLAGLQYRLQYRRTEMLLRMREGLDWSSFVHLSTGVRVYSVSTDGPLSACVPALVSVEYLVAELERHGYEFTARGTAGDRVLTLIPRSPERVMPKQESSAWISRFSDRIAQYIRFRDGIQPIPVMPDRFALEQSEHGRPKRTLGHLRARTL